MHEYMSLKVSSTEHADLATQLTTLSTQGWAVVNIVSTGVDLIAYLSRQQSQVSSLPSSSINDTSSGWATAASQTAPASLPSSATTTPTSQPQTTPAVPADWYPDPSRRYEYRYWDGVKWTDNVARAGVTYKDPPVP